MIPMWDTQRRQGCKRGGGDRGTSVVRTKNEGIVPQTLFSSLSWLLEL